MSPVAEQLRAARESQKLTIPQVAEITKIRTDHLRALEEGDYNMFSAPVYIRGFVRNYARFLKLDVPQITAALEAELSQTEKFSEPPPLMEGQQTWLDRLMFLLSKLDWRKSLLGLGTLAVILLIIVLGALWRHHGRTRPLNGMQPALYQSSNAGETLPVPKP